MRPRSRRRSHAGDGVFMIGVRHGAGAPANFDKSNVRPHPATAVPAVTTATNKYLSITVKPHPYFNELGGNISFHLCMFILFKLCMLSIDANKNLMRKTIAC